jgi:hypothetical protein
MAYLGAKLDGIFDKSRIKACFLQKHAFKNAEKHIFRFRAGFIFDISGYVYNRKKYLKQYAGTRKDSYNNRNSINNFRRIIYLFP